MPQKQCALEGVFSIVFLERSEPRGTWKPENNYTNILESERRIGLEILVFACASMCVSVCAHASLCVFAKTDLMFKDKPLKRQ